MPMSHCLLIVPPAKSYERNAKTRICTTRRRIRIGLKRSTRLVDPLLWHKSHIHERSRIEDLFLWFVVGLLVLLTVQCSEGARFGNTKIEPL